jgi:hypothetical protein
MVFGTIRSMDDAVDKTTPLMKNDDHDGAGEHIRRLARVMYLNYSVGSHSQWLSAMFSPINYLPPMGFGLMHSMHRADSLTVRQNRTHEKRRSWFARWLSIQWRRFVCWMAEPISYPMQIPPPAFSPVRHLPSSGVRSADLSKCVGSLPVERSRAQRKRRSWLVRWLSIQWRSFVRWMKEPIRYPMQIPSRDDV